MNKKIIEFLIVGMFIGIGVLPIVTSSNFVDRLDQYQINIPSGLIGFSTCDEEKLAQSFIPTVDTLTRVEIACAKQSFDGDVILSIRNSLDEEDLTMISRHTNDFPEPGLMKWIEFDFPDISVNPGETYYIVLDAPSAIWDPPLQSSRVTWWCTFYIPPDDPYPDGALWRKAEGWYENIWFKLDDVSPSHIHDFIFKTYGIGGDVQFNIVIDSVVGGFRLSADIKNDGPGTAYDIEWSIDLEGGLILQGGHDSDTIDELQAGASESIRLSSLFGIGPTTITVTVGEVSKQASGFILGPLVLNVREI